MTIDECFGRLILRPSTVPNAMKNSNAIFTSQKTSSPTKFAPVERKHTKTVPAKVPKTMPSFQPKETSVSSNLGVPPSAQVSASDMIKVMQDFQTKKKSFCCIVCKYETPHQGTIKRHVETKHMPQAPSLNSLQCPRSFNLKQNLKTHYMKKHGLLEPAAKAMLP